MTENQMQIVKDLPNKKVTVTRRFEAPLEQVWRAWTESELLDQWWAPKPWKAETKTMDFRPGGKWLYAMVGPDGSRHWARVDYLAVNPLKSYSALDMFCNEEGEPNSDMPQMRWHNTFEKEGSGTKVLVEITFEKESDMEKIMEMGFEEGFAAGLHNLDAYLANVH